MTDRLDQRHHSERPLSGLTAEELIALKELGDVSFLFRSGLEDQAAAIGYLAERELIERDHRKV